MSDQVLPPAYMICKKKKNNHSKRHNHLSAIFPPKVVKRSVHDVECAGRKKKTNEGKSRLDPQNGSSEGKGNFLGMPVKMWTRTSRGEREKI